MMEAFCMRQCTMKLTGLAYNQHFSDGMEELDDLLYMVTQETSDGELYGFIDSKGLWDGVCRYESTWGSEWLQKKR